MGIDDHELTGLDEVTSPACFDTQKGPDIGIVHEYAHLGKGRSIHLLDKWNGLTAKWMTDQKLMGMCSHSPLDLNRSLAYGTLLGVLW